MPSDDTNLVLRAAHALREAAGVRAGGALHLVKRIPAEAGLGGGSSDAAAALRLLARLWDLGRCAALLEDVARTIGSDVPFFLRGGTALATGRGDQLEALAPRPRAHFVVLVPPFGVSTKVAYREVRWLTRPPRTSSMATARTLIGERARLPGTRGASRLRNTFEQTVFATHPSLGRLKRCLIDAGAADAALSGTGSAVFGIARSRADARRIAARCAATGLSVYTVASVCVGSRITVGQEREAQ